MKSALLTAALKSFPTSTKTFAVNNPSDGSVIAEVPDMPLNAVEKMIGQAHSAWPSYSKLLAKDRSKLLRRLYDLIMQHKEDIAQVMTAESGKVISESRGEVDYGASFIEWFAEEAKRSYGDTVPSPHPNKRIVVIKQSVGVTAAITPWNFPLAMITRKIGPALAAGCPVLVKPAGETPLTAILLHHLVSEAGFDKDVYHTITTTDSSAVGELFCKDERIRKISFTGSTEVGRKLMEGCASTIKKLSLELGGNAPFIVFDDADIDAAVKGAIQSKFRHNGQTCVCVNRILVQESVYDSFASKFTDAVQQLKTGDVTGEDVQVGPLISEKGLDKVKKHIDDATFKGGSILTGGKVRKNLFFEPTVIADATPDMIIAKEEVFGPVAPLFKFSTEKEAVEMANDTIFGLAAYFYSKSVDRCWRIGEALEYGMVGINEGIISTEVAPFGGIKQSGVGREGSKYGMDAYTEIKYLCFGI